MCRFIVCIVYIHRYPSFLTEAALTKAVSTKAESTKAAFVKGRIIFKILAEVKHRCFNVVCFIPFLHYIENHSFVFSSIK